MSTSTSRTVREHFRLLFTLIHAMGQSGAEVIDTENRQPLDPDAPILAPESGHPHTYQVTLSDTRSDLVTQIYLIQTLLVSDSVVEVRYHDHEGEHQEEIVKIGWGDLAQLEATPFSVMPKDYRGLVPLFPQGCTFFIKI